MRKYRNTPTTVDGIRFDSRKEAARYSELKLLEKAGEINEVTLQPEYHVYIRGQKICTYKADFRYWQGATRIVEDVKSPATRKNPTYRLKKKLVEAVYGIKICEV